MPSIGRRFARVSNVLVAIVATLSIGSVAGAQQADRLIVQPDEPITVTIEENDLKISVETGNIDRLVLDQDTVARLGLKPAGTMGKANVRIGPTRILQGRNRPMTFAVEGKTEKARVFWFDGAADGPVDGTIGPWGLPQDQVEIRLGGGGTTLYRFPLLGSVNSQSVTSFKHDGGALGLTFAVEDRGRYPIASAAAGAAIAKAYDAVATDEVWDEVILLGVRRPVRLVELGRPLIVGPFSFSKIAVRVRDRRDGSGSGDSIAATAASDNDAAEIVVTAAESKGPAPIFTLSIGRASLQKCSSLNYAKRAKEIQLHC
jgi:hypothetical protein